MNSDFQLEKYLSDGVEIIVKSALRASLKNPRESIFIAKFAHASKEAAAIRSRYEKAGLHIPPFLICSITDRCNLNCVGCYSRANHSRRRSAEEPLEITEWKRIFKEAEEAGISFILLAGGEPFMRPEVIEAAADYKRIMFTVFTNGTLFDDKMLSLFDKNRNLLPVLSIEGDLEFTDTRRGQGIYAAAGTVMQKLNERGIFYGVSITATGKNLTNITNDAFLSRLYGKGCKVAFYVEYVPVSAQSAGLTLTEQDREKLEISLNLFREKYEDMIFLSFPGDEKSTGGCLAAGRGFFHINSDGSAEPCPFSPYSDTNIKNCTLLEALQSPLFTRLAAGDILSWEHKGGCVLFEREEEVKRLCSCSD